MRARPDAVGGSGSWSRLGSSGRVIGERAACGPAGGGQSDVGADGGVGPESAFVARGQAQAREPSGEGAQRGGEFEAGQGGADAVVRACAEAEVLGEPGP